MDGVTRVAVHAPSEWEPAEDGASCRFSVQPDLPATITLGNLASPSGAAVIDSTLAEWRQSIPMVTTSSQPRGTDDLLGTTAAVLVGLRRRDGGIVAAPTTSLPQWPGSSRTWDYQMCIRDSASADRMTARNPGPSRIAVRGRLDLANSENPFRGRIRSAPTARRRCRDAARKCTARIGDEGVQSSTGAEQRLSLIHI